VNPNQATGTIELLAKRVAVLNEAKTPPFEIDKDTKGITEELRLQYRYLDLRSERMQKNIKLRHRMLHFCRNWLTEHGFTEVETPTLTKGTPEGAREYIVPARNYPGKFYVLPQSPQQFKQLLMVAGLERYFQFARCWRDEDQRGDRQPEFTQLDLEMSFVEREDVMALNEALLIALVKAVAPEKKIQEIPFPRLSYREAMEKYGTDRPDVRHNKQDPNTLAFCWVVDFPFFEKTDEGGWTFTHNPFSAPKPEHGDWLMKKERIPEILTTQYDVVLNGWEIGGGSVRNHTPEALKKVFEVMGLDSETNEGKFGHMFEALSFGAPPHGGIAWGFDRLVTLLANEPNIREVIAFPKTSDARDVLMGAPSEVSKKQLDELGIQLKAK
jgi:aspartyl-tRNA synthetase